MAAATRAKARPADFTGLQADRLAAEAKVQQEERIAEMSMITAQGEADATGEVDYSQGIADDDIETVGGDEEPEEFDEVEFTGPVTVAQKLKRFRVNSDLEDVTIGHGNTYSFKPGPWYTAPKSVYDHLEEKGYIYH